MSVFFSGSVLISLFFFAAGHQELCVAVYGK